MATRKTETEQLPSVNRIDDVRRELDAKIDGKISTTIFLGILGVLAVLVLAIANNIMNQATAATNKVEDINKRVTVLETILNERKNIQPQVVPLTPQP